MKLSLAMGGRFLPTTGGTLTGQLIVPDGTAAEPGIRLTSEATGFYSISANILGVSIAGALRARFGLGGISLTDTAGSYLLIDGGGSLRFKTRLFLTSPADGKLIIRNNGDTAGVLIDASTDGIGTVRNRGDTGYGTWQCGNLTAQDGIQAIGSGGYIRTTVGAITAGNSNANGGGHVIESAPVVTTTDATVTTLWSSPVLAEGAAFIIEAYIVGLKSDGSQGAGYVRLMTARRAAGGNITLVGSVYPPMTVEDDPAWNATMDVDTGTQTARIRVTGPAASTVKWRAMVRYQKVALA